jgi:cytochrome c
MRAAPARGEQALEVMMCELILVTLLSLAISMLLPPAIAADGNAARGQQVFRACAACHTLEPDRHMTGTSLANPWGRRAGGLASFPRYSSALQSSGIVWNDAILNEWISISFQATTWTFEGVKHSWRRTCSFQSPDKM